MWWVGGGKGEIKQTLIQLEAARLLDLHFVLIPKIVWTFPHFPHNAEMEVRIEKKSVFHWISKIWRRHAVPFLRGGLLCMN